MIRRIHILGSTGSGKTHLSSLLAQRLNIPAFDLDDLFWDRSATTYGIRTPAETRDCKLSQIVSGESWIIEGAYYQWVGPSFDRADIILAMMPSVWVRDGRIIRRFLKRKLGLAASKRESLRDLWALLRWNHNFDRHNYPRALSFIAARGRTVLPCKSTAEALAAIESTTSTRPTEKPQA
jgi:adenylate kinase family enzyme